MNTNLLSIVKQIIAQNDEDILTDARRMNAFFGDLAKDEPKSEKRAFLACIELGCYTLFKNAGAERRDEVKRTLAERLRADEGFDLALCNDALDLFAAALCAGQPQTPRCPSCGKEIDPAWKACPFCGNVIHAPPSETAPAQDASSTAQETAPAQETPVAPETTAVPQQPPDDALSWLNQGYAHYQEKNYEQAIAAYSEALRIYPDYAAAYYNRSIAYTDQGNHEQAKADYDEAMRIDPKTADAAPAQITAQAPETAPAHNNTARNVLIAAVIAAVIAIFVLYSKNNELQNANYELYTEHNTLKTAYRELETTFNSWTSPYTINVTALRAGNWGDGKMLTQSVSGVSSARSIRYLRPDITFSSLIEGEKTFYIRILDTAGDIYRNRSTSPAGYTYSQKITVRRGLNSNIDLGGWGSNEGGGYWAGAWTIEIWLEGSRMYSQVIYLS
jgi:tetratricopeptide (TPR) repeat protein